jgi:putative spermidine/putrescine transport system permease protein
MVRLGRAWQWLLLTGAVMYILVPMVAVVLYSLSTRWTSNILPDGYTLEHWREAVTEDRMQAAIFRTAWLAAAVCLLDVLLVVPAVYWQRVRNPRIRFGLELAAAIPFVLPFIVIAFGILKLAGQFAPELLGHWYLLLAGHAAVAFPFLYWAVDGAMAAANVVRLNEAAQACGASPAQILRHVVVPNISVGIATGTMLVFATSFGEFALAQILVGARFENVSLYSLNLLTETTSQYEKLAVLTVITFVILFVISTGVVIANRGQATRLLPGARVVTGERSR